MSNLKNVSKYNLLFLLAANLTSQYKPLVFLSEQLFYISLAIGLLCVFINIPDLLNQKKRNAIPLLFSLITIYSLYHFTIGIQYWNGDSWNYYLARVVTLLITFFGVTSNYKFYFEDLMFWLSIVIAACLVYGTIIDGTAAQGRYYLAFGNPNSTSAISTVGFAGFLYCKNRPKYVWIMGAIICLWGVTAGGSRTMSVLCILAMILRFKFSLKTIVIFFFASIILVRILPLLGLETIAIDRLVDVFENKNFVGSREDVRQATMMMIDMRPIEGWGFKSGIVGEAAEISVMGSHNGYLDIIKAMGYPFAILIFVVIFLNLFRIRKYVFSKDPIILYHCFIIIAVLLGAMYESMLHGVNYILNTLFYTSFSLLTYRMKMRKNVNTAKDNL